MKPIFNTNKKSGEKSPLFVKTFEGCPSFMLTGGEVVFVSDDFKEVHLKFNLRYDTNNYHGTGFGGAIYASLDPIYPLQLWHILGDDYIIWDLAATIDYLKPVTQDVYANFLLTDETISKIKEDISTKNKSVITLPVEYKDTDGNIYTKATKTIYIADKVYFENKNKNKLL
ncbi:MAG: acyl-coenzyme A thioesterase PaaI-like protein [Francisella sp.]|jgi:acyl-coenzyme A thioesterase PaaI-like protein